MQGTYELGSFALFGAQNDTLWGEVPVASDLPVIPNRFDRTVIQRVLAKRFLVGRLRLLEDVREARFVVADEVRRRGLATEVAIDALRIDVVSARCLTGHFIVGICQSGAQKRVG